MLASSIAFSATSLIYNWVRSNHLWGEMMVHVLAGKPAPRSLLVNLPRLVPKGETTQRIEKRVKEILPKRIQRIFTLEVQKA